MRILIVATQFWLMAVPGLLAQGDPLTVDEIVQMIKAGVSESVIMEKLKLDGCDCRASAVEIMTLRGAHASDALVREVIAASSRGVRRSEPVPERRPVVRPRDFPRLETSAGLNWLRFESGESLWGWQLEGQGNFSRWIGVFGEFSHQPGKLKLFDLVSGITFAEFDVNAVHLHAGPKATFRNNAVTGFVRGGVGVSRFSVDFDDPASGLRISISDSALSWIGGAGLDVNLTPGIAVRVVQADYLGFRHTNVFGSETVNNFRVGFGVVFKGR